MSLIRHLLRHLHLGLWLVILLFSATVQADMTLAARYQRLKSGSDTTLPGTTITLTSLEQKGLLSADATSILPFHFESVAAALTRSANWCQFMPLHFNIKACTSEAREGGDLLTFYSGRKTYQTPEESYALTYRFEVVKEDEGQMALRLYAARGPAGTRDYRIEVNALRVKEGTLLHIHSSYHPSLTSTLLTHSYLSTLGRDKVGFSYVTDAGVSHPVQGMRGVIERNVMRYQLAIETFLGTLALPEPMRHDAALRRWFSLNDSYPQQLHEMTESEYLEIKQQEWRNQQDLQQSLNEKLHRVVLH